jgi:very-short-patch-repair endonuclease
LRVETRPEQLLRKALNVIGITYHPQFPVDWYVIDFYLPDLHLALEADGDYWHSSPEAVARDRRRDATLALLGIRTVRIRESDMDNAADLATLVRQRLNLDF